jgi:hypothetical protein
MEVVCMGPHQALNKQSFPLLRLYAQGRIRARDLVHTEHSVSGLDIVWLSIWPGLFESCMLLCSCVNAHDDGAGVQGHVVPFHCIVHLCATKSILKKEMRMTMGQASKVMLYLSTALYTCVQRNRFLKKNPQTCETTTLLLGKGIGAHSNPKPCTLLTCRCMLVGPWAEPPGTIEIRKEPM